MGVRLPPFAPRLPSPAPHRDWSCKILIVISASVLWLRSHGSDNLQSFGSRAKSFDFVNTTVPAPRLKSLPAQSERLGSRTLGPVVEGNTAKPAASGFGVASSKLARSTTPGGGKQRPTFRGSQPPSRTLCSRPVSGAPGARWTEQSKERRGRGLGPPP